MDGRARGDEGLPPLFWVLVGVQDNAGSYSSPLHLHLLPVSAARYGLKVTSFVHTEPSDGKSPLVRERRQEPGGRALATRMTTFVSVCVCVCVCVCVSS
jgi:hypothetical protein